MSEYNSPAPTRDWPDPNKHPSELWRGYQTGDFSGAEILAHDLRSKFAANAAPRAMLLAVCADRNWRIEKHRIGAGKSPSTLRAVLVPMLAGGFSIVLNSEYAYGSQTDAVYTALIGHEVCHASVFYNTGTPPKRRIHHTQREEDFCDIFAQSLTGINLDDAIKELSVMTAKQS